MNFNERLKDLRIERGLTQKELATQLSLNQSSIARFEKGDRFPELDTFIKIADYFSVTLDFLNGNLNKENVSASNRLIVDSPPSDVKEFGEWLKDIRDESNLTITALSEKIGYSNTEISVIETGKIDNYPDAEYLKKFAESTNVSYLDLLIAAGYDALAIVEKHNELEKDFAGIDFTKYLTTEQNKESNKITHISDIKYFLEEDYKSAQIKDEQESYIISPKYNGYSLTDNERKQIVQLIEIALPHLSK